MVNDKDDIKKVYLYKYNDLMYQDEWEGVVYFNILYKPL
jgi:hypothetical protein